MVRRSNAAWKFRTDGEGRMTRRGMLGAVAAGGMLWSGLGCRRARRARDELVVLVNAEPEHLDPRYPGDALGATLARLVYSGLLDCDPCTFVPRLALAESLENVGPARLRARLRSDVRFHDGSPLTVDDVVATYSAILDPRLGSPLRGTYARVFERVEALDRRTIDFVLHGPDGTYGSLLQQPIVRARDAGGTELVARAGGELRFVGTGPMRVRRLDDGAWEFERVRASANGARRVRFQTMHDPNTFALRLLHGDADIGEIKPELFAVFAGRPGFQVSSARSVGFTYMGIRNDHPWLAERVVRRAMAHAIDRESLRRGKLGEFAVASSGPLPPTHWAHEPSVQAYPYDPVRARELLASVPRWAGAPLVLRVSNVRFVVTVADAIAAMLGAVGIDVEVRRSDLATVLADLRAGRYDLTLLTAPDLSDPWGVAWLFASTSIPTASQPRAGGNRWRYRNPRLDALLESGRAALGIAERVPYYRAAQCILAEDLPVIPLWHADLVFASSAKLANVRPRGDAQWEFLLDMRLH